MHNSQCCRRTWMPPSSMLQRWFRVLMQHWYLSVELCCVTSWKNTIFVFTYLTSSNPRGFIFAEKVVICFVFQCFIRVAMSFNQHGITVAYHSFRYLHCTSYGFITITQAVLTIDFKASNRQILTFRGPCIMIYSYNKTNKMH